MARRPSGLTEEQWLTLDSPLDLYSHARNDARSRREPLPHRRFRLVGCAWCRHVWPLLVEEASRAAVEAAERFADGQAKKAELARHSQSAGKALTALRARKSDRPGEPLKGRTALLVAAEMAMYVSSDSVQDAIETVGVTAGRLPGSLRRSPPAGVEVPGLSPSLRELTDLLRDVFANPFRRVVVVADVAWRTPTVASLAEAAYAERLLPRGHLDPARLGVLADAAEEAGCGAAGLIQHLRQPGPHVRGCWAVDLLRGVG